MRILIDHNLDRRLKDYLPGHEVKTVFEMGWLDLLNGELLDQAEQGRFEALLTGDSNIKHQQNLANRPIAIIVLRARDNRFETREVSEVIVAIAPGQLVEIAARK